MGRTLLPLAIATVVACVSAATGLAAGSTQVTHVSFTKPSNVCGISGTTIGHRTSVFRDTGNGTYFMNSSFSGVFTAENGKSTTLTSAGPQKQTSPPVIDEQAVELAPHHYHSAQLHNGVVRSALLGDADLVVLCTRFYDFDG